MRRLGQLYHYWLHEAPLLTKVLTAATLSGAGDRLAQRIEAGNPSAAGSEQDARRNDNDGLVSTSTARTLRMMVWGGLFTAPIMHTWFHLIERAIPGTGKVVVAKKVLADMVIMAPAMALGFFTVTKSMEGERLSDAFDVAKAKLRPTMEMNYKVWPLANLMVFTLVPFQYRTPFVNCVSLGWSTFLSMMNSNKLKSVEEAEDIVVA
jgi:protein Mpv17